MFSIFYNMKVYCVFSLESPHQDDSNTCTQYTIFNIKKKTTLNYSRKLWDFFKGLKNEFEIVLVNVPLVFEPLKVYCISSEIKFDRTASSW